MPPPEAKALAKKLHACGLDLSSVLEILADPRRGVESIIDLAVQTFIPSLLMEALDQIVGERQPGKKSPSGMVRFGTQPGLVRLADRSLRIIRPRARTKATAHAASKEVDIPAYHQLQSPAAGAKMCEAMVRGLSTRSYEPAVREMAGTVGLSRNSVSKAFIKKSEDAFKLLAERRLGDLSILAVFIDGIEVGGQLVLVAIGLDDQGFKHVLGMREGASENTVAVMGLLEDIVARGLDPSTRRLMVIDGSKALRAGIRRVFGEVPIQRCRIHKLRNVLDQIVDEECHAQTKAVMQAAFRLPAGEGIAKLTKYASRLATVNRRAANSLLEGLEEMFTINTLGCGRVLERKLCTTNLIESPNSTIRKCIGNVKRWHGAAMVQRWTAAALLRAEKTWRRMDGHKGLWVLKEGIENWAPPGERSHTAMTAA